MATNLLVDGQILGGNTNSSGSTGVTIGLNKTTMLNEAGAKTYVLPAPVAGATLRLIKISTSTAAQVANSTLAGTAATIQNSTATNLNFSLQGQVIELLASSASKWEIVTNTGTVTLS